MPFLGLKTPQITWGTATASFAYPVDNWATYSQPREGTQFIQTLSGVEDSWYVGDDYVFEGDFRWIPAETSSGITGWNGASGIRALLEYARRKQSVRFYPDSTASTYYTCYLVAPLDGGHSLEADGTRSLRLVLRTPDSAIEGY